MKPQRKLICNQVVLIPREHTSTFTKKGTLKSKVRTSPMIHLSDTLSPLVQRISLKCTPKSLLLALRSSILMSLRGILEIIAQIQLFLGTEH